MQLLLEDTGTCKHGPDEVLVTTHTATPVVSALVVSTFWFSWGKAGIAATRAWPLMEMMAADEMGGTFSEVKGALDIRAHPGQTRIHFCIIQVRCARASYSSNLFFFQHCLCLRLSIKPFSQQAYSMQTAGTTTISGERAQGVIISFLPGEQSVLEPTTCSLRGWVFTLFPLPGSPWTLTESGQRQKWEEKCAWVSSISIMIPVPVMLWWR